mmetsp:Transcript_14829/g.46408  ORF Transcript_14829/g.46408 Transcript_14829/m.46408 type:complete len:200 (+) Transcript_14829:406-1005(+)
METLALTANFVRLTFATRAVGCADRKLSSSFPTSNGAAPERRSVVAANAKQVSAGAQGARSPAAKPPVLPGAAKPAQTLALPATHAGVLPQRCWSAQALGHGARSVPSALPVSRPEAALPRLRSRPVPRAPPTRGARAHSDNRECALRLQPPSPQLLRTPRRFAAMLRPTAASGSQEASNPEGAAMPDSRSDAFAGMLG